MSEPAYLADLEALGYEVRAREPGHRALRAGEPDEPVNLHRPVIEEIMFRARSSWPS